jgi:Na+/proline symporter
MIASKLKQHAPYCHTYLEIIRARWGKVAHLTFLFFGMATNIIVSSESSVSAPTIQQKQLLIAQPC